MALTMRVNGLHHAISLGNIEASSEQTGSAQFEKCYDSDDENMSRHRLRTSSSTELYPRTSVYSKGDIREQYCLTDRQLSSIEHPRRERFFGCLSRRGAPQSFLGVCVGRRAPSDENLAAYAPFYKYPRYQHHYPQDGKTFDSDMESSYFRRQPASILSTANKFNDASGGNRYSWTDSHSQTNPDNGMLGNDSSIYGCAAHGNLPPAPPPPGPSTPRTKHVSFARSHTLTSFDDVNLGLRSSGRLTSTRSQERLIGGKKPIIASGSIYEPMQMLQNTSSSQQMSGGTQLQQQQHQNILHHPHLHGHQHGHSHGHQHHLGPPIHVHQIVPIYHSELDTQLGMRRETTDNFTGMNMGVSLSCHPPNVTPPSPEVVVVEKKFRNAMKTQATQTELRKGEGQVHHLELSPRTIHKVKVVSQGAQTNGLINGKKLTKSLSEMPNNQDAKNSVDRSTDALKSLSGEHDTLHRTQSEEPPRSPHQPSRPNTDNQYNVMYYNPPPPIEVTGHQAAQSLFRRGSRISSIDSNQSYPPDDKIPPDSSLQSTTTHSDMKHEGSNQTFTSYQDSSVNYDDSCGMGIFDYESNSLPRRACSYHRLDNDLYSNSLPRKDPIHSHEICRHITDCTELLGDSNITDFSRQHLLPPPRQYRKEEEQPIPRQRPQEDHYATINRRMSMVSTPQISGESPFKRDDIRRQSMPVSSRTEKADDGYRRKPNIATMEFHSSEEKEIFIDFKPHISPKLTTKKHPRHRKVQKTVSDGEMLLVEQQRIYKEDDSESNASIENASTSNVDSEVDEEEEEKEDPLYENVPSYSFLAPEIEKRNQFRKRSISLEDSGVKNESVIIKSAPPSPCQDEMLINTSTYPSSDSLANDLTRDHSDGIWNESQVTVLTADPRDLSEPDHGASHLLTPSSKRKNLILQHQQRSSIDTDALDLEDQFTDHSPTASSKNSFPTPGFTLQAKNREFTSTLSVPTNMVTPTIAVTPTCPIPEFDLPSSRRSPNNSRRSSKSLSPSTQDISKTDLPFHQISPQKNVDAQVSGNNYGYIRSESAKWNTNNTDISECSTNTDEYVTCTDTSKRTPGIKTPPTTTSSSSTTQVPVSAQSSQTEKTHGGSSFESASSLYSTRGDGLSEDIPQLDKDDKLRTTKSDGKQSVISTADPSAACPIRSPSHSISSTSSGSYNMAAIQIAVPAKLPSDEIAETKNSSSVALPPATKAGVGQSTLERENPRKHRESISEDDRSDIRYSSSGYYESPHDDEHGNMGKLRRHRLEEDRKRRRTSMKLDIEKENLRALTSPIKKTQAAQATLPKDKSPEKQQANTNIDASSPSKIKRFRPKIRRQLRRTSRDESTTRRPKTVTTLYGIQAPLTSEKLLDCSLQENAGKPPETETKIQRTTQTAADQIQNSPPPTKAPELSSTNTNTNTSVADVYQLKAKSVESLRSVSPGSDSVFYSEADGTGGDPHSHCLHCGKEMEVSNPAIGAVAGDSVESLPCIDNDTEQDIVKPPSDFADSPVTTKTTQRLYKKMDKRFRSEERYHAERGRHFKTRQDNIRAKSEERGREKSIRSPQLLRPAGSSPCVLPDVNTEQKNQIIYRGHYDNSRYSRLTDADVWTQLDHQSFDRHRERRASTESEKSFHAKYQVILHRLVQRRCTLEMYHRQKNNIFQLISSNSSPESVRRKLEEVLKLMLMVWAREGQVLSKISQDKHGIDKTVVVKSDSGEFGFRIHGSKPVVVAAIEPDTPAESSGLEVGDIIISVNGVQVLDKHHTEVVKIAHAGCETLELEVARTIGVLMNEQQETPSKPVFSGYLWRQSGQAKGAPNAKKWVRRWFCLRPDHCLYYYKTEEDTQPVGAMIMAKHSVEQCPPEIGKPFAFKIDSGEGIPMYVAADSEELANQWMNILKRSTVNSDPWLEKCARALHQPPSGIARPDCFGYLMKLGSRWCGWSKRYCVLKDACLYFYQDANSKNAFGMACLQGYKVASMSTNASGRKNSFEIIPQEPKLRHYYFSTESEMDKKRWISALEYSIDRWIKSG